MSDLHSTHLRKPARMAELQRRLSYSRATVTLELSDESSQPDIEAFLIAVFDLAANTHSLREQEEGLQGVLAQRATADRVCWSQSGFDIILTRKSCEVSHALDECLPTEKIAPAMLQALVALDDPAGMMLDGLAKVWDLPTVKIAVPRSRFRR